MTSRNEISPDVQPRPQSASPRKARRWIIAAAVFVAVLVAHDLSPVLQCCDSRWVLHRAESILTEGNTDLDEYSDFLKSENYYMIEFVNGHAYDQFPIGASIVALPFVAITEVWDRLVYHHGFQEKLKHGCGWKEQRFIASFLVALASALLYLVAMARLGSAWKSLLVVFVFAFCTSAWSTASRSLWQHAPSMLMLTGTLYLFVLAEKKPKLIQYAGLLLAFAYVIRPTNSISIAALTVLVLVRYRRYFLHYLGWAAVIAVPFFVFNYSVYGSLLPSYFGAQRIGTNAHFWEALAGNMVSPARGLFVFSPVLLLSLVGVGIKVKEKRLDGLDVSLLVVIVLHWVAISTYVKWWAGHSFGPRFMTDMLPYFAYFLIPVVEKLARPATWRVLALGAVLLVLMAGSFFANYRGAFRGETMFWNVTPQGVDERLDRLWDWKDLQFLR